FHVTGVQTCALPISMKFGQELKADVIMATDPDADRVGVDIPNDKGEYQLINGNQIGSLLAYYVLSSKKDKGALKENDYIVKTIVTTNLIADIGDDLGVQTYETLTGFKYI